MSFRAKIAIAITLLLLAILGLGGSVIYIACSKYFQQTPPTDENMSCPRDSEASQGNLAELETKHGLNSPKLIPVLDRLADLGDAQAAVRALRLRTINLLPEDYDTAKTKLSLVRLRYSYAMNPETTRQALQLLDDAKRIVATTKGKRSAQLIHLEIRRADYLPVDDKIKVLDDLYQSELKSKPVNEYNLTTLSEALVFTMQTGNRLADIPKYRRAELQRTIDRDGEKSPSVIGKRCELATSLVNADQFEEAYKAILPAWKSRELTKGTDTPTSYSSLLTDYLSVLSKLKNKEPLKAVTSEVEQDWQTQPSNISFNHWRNDGCNTASCCYDYGLNECGAAVIEAIAKPDAPPKMPRERDTDAPSYLEEYHGSATMVAHNMIALSQKCFQHKDGKSASLLLDRIEKDISQDKRDGNPSTEIQNDTRDQYVQERFEQLIASNDWSAAQKLLSDQIQLCKKEGSTDTLFNLHHNQYVLLTKMKNKAPAKKLLIEVLAPYDEELVASSQNALVLCDDLHQLGAHKEEEMVLRRMVKRMADQEPLKRWDCTAHLCRCLAAQKRMSDAAALTGELTGAHFRTLIKDESQPFPTELARWLPEGKDKKEIYTLARQLTAQDRGSAWADSLVYLDAHGDKTAWIELNHSLLDDLYNQDYLENYDDESLRGCLKLAIAHKQVELQEQLSEALKNRANKN